MRPSLHTAITLGNASLPAYRAASGSPIMPAAAPHTGFLSARHRFIKLVFFGNYFYALCAIGLAIEASLQQRLPLNDWFFYLAMGSATVLYYTKAYITEFVGDPHNKRSVWYSQNRKLVWWSQVILTAIVAAYVMCFAVKYWRAIWALTPLEWVLGSAFPVVAALYYGLSGKQFAKWNLRNTGWMKPFFIGFTWAGWVNIYPVLAHHMQAGTHYSITLFGCLLFLKNFMFVSVLCIMFDIKDYAVDYNQQLKTFVVKAGLRKTIFYIIIPLCLLGLGTFIIYGLSQHFHPLKIALNIIPFALLITVAYSLHRRKPILYYLAIIDGLMLAKAICGSIAMIFF